MNEYSGVLNELEEIRKSVMPKQLISFGLMIAAFVGFFLTVFSSMGTLNTPNGAIMGMSAMAFVIGLILFLVWAMPAMNDYKAVYKDTIVKSVMSKNMDKISYDPKMGFQKEYIRATGFMMLGNRYKTEDLIVGSYKDVKFRRADVLIQDHRSNGKNSYTVTYFRGRWMVFEFNKNFSRDLQIIQAGFGYTNKKKSIFTNSAVRRHKVEFENESFNRAFECLCQDEQEAFYLITPQMQEALMNFARVIDGKVMFGFKGNVVNVAIENGKDMLEPSVYRPVNYENDVLPLLQERNIIQSFVDILKLDRSIYK